MRAVALDYYADTDTSEAAQAALAVKPGLYGFDDGDLLAKASRLAPAKDFPLVYGSGLLPAAAHSLLFLAGSNAIEPIGFNRLHHISTPTHPFLFAGATEARALHNQVKAEITTYAKEISQTLSLRGLNSLDFLIYGNACFILELNCRPSATLALYDADFKAGILAAHIRACLDGSLEPARERKSVKGFKVVIAEQALTIPAGFEWPLGCFDRPKQASTVSKGDPLCTLEAQGASEAECHKQLDRKEQMLLNQLLKDN